MLVVARVGNDDPPRKREEAHLLLWLETIVSTQIIGERGRDVLGSFIQSLVAFPPGVASLTCFRILSGFGPEGFVGSTDLTGDIAGQSYRVQKHSGLPSSKRLCMPTASYARL